MFFMLPFATVYGGEPDLTPYELARKPIPKESPAEAALRRVEEEALGNVNELIRKGLLSGSEIPLKDADRE